jgi:hypothetical protein
MLLALRRGARKWGRQFCLPSSWPMNGRSWRRHLSKIRDSPGPETYPGPACRLDTLSRPRFPRKSGLCPEPRPPPCIFRGPAPSRERKASGVPSDSPRCALAIPRRCCRPSLVAHGWRCFCARLAAFPTSAIPALVIAPPNRDRERAESCSRCIRALRAVSTPCALNRDRLGSGILFVPIVHINLRPAFTSPPNLPPLIPSTTSVPVNRRNRRTRASYELRLGHSPDVSPGGSNDADRSTN